MDDQKMATTNQEMRAMLNQAAGGGLAGPDPEQEMIWHERAGAELLWRTVRDHGNPDDLRRAKDALKGIAQEILTRL